MTDVDLLVAGAGGGLAGALRAAQLGASVLVVEANEHFQQGNNTAMSTAMIPGAGSRYQRAAGIDDSPERFRADIEAKTHGSAEPTVARALAEVSAELVEWLADHVGLPIELPTDFSYPGHSAQRVHTIPGRHGSALLRGLLTAVAAEPNIDLLVPCRLDAVEPGCRVTLSRPDGSSEQLTAGAVLLATNGYGADPGLVARHVPEIASATYHGSEYSTGDALRIGAALGAESGFLDAYQGHAGLAESARTLVTWATIMHGGILVDLDGRRFGDESVGYSEYAALLARQRESRGWLVFDERVHDACLPFRDYQDVMDSGALRAGGSVAELAEAIGVPAQALAEEIDEARQVATGELAKDRFGRTNFEAPLGTPLRAVRVVPALFHTQGGLLVDEHARVRNVAGLYASGGAAAGISGHGATGYLAGNGLLPALGLAYLAGQHVARTTRSEGAQ
ncbi:MAG TPA: FAD-binding protein [Pseudonocardiaceae bacterium]|nr:FAD-binding protein [Pseudonocardiaceae bacterium]